MRSTSASSSHVALSPGGYAHTLVTPKPFSLGSEEPPTPPSPGCSIPFMVFLAAPKMAMNMAWAAQWAAFGPLLETLLPSWSVQLVQIIGPLTGLFVAPTIGVLSDACTSSYGRRRPFILFGAVASSICWLVMSYARELGVAMGDHGPHQSWTATWTVLCYIWMDITVNMTQVPVSLILADFAGERQVTAASIGQAFSIAGSFCISGYILLFGPAHASIHPFMWMLVAVMLGTALPVCMWATEKPYLAHNSVSRCKQLQNAFGSVYTGLRNLPRVLVSFCVCFLLIQYGYTAYNGAKGQFFGLRVYHGDAEGANTCEPSNCSDAQKAFNKGVRVAGGITDTIFNGVGLVYLAVLPWLVRKCGAKIVFTWAILPQALLIAMAFSSIVQLNVAIVVLCAVTQNTIFAMQIPVILHVVGHGPENQLGLFAGAFNSANCAGQLINFLLATLLVQTSMGHALPVLVGGVLSLLALVIAQLTFHIDMKSL